MVTVDGIQLPTSPGSTTTLLQDTMEHELTDAEISELYNYMPPRPRSEYDYDSDVMNHIRVNGSPVDSDEGRYHEDWPTPPLEEFIDYPHDSRVILYPGVFFELWVELDRAFVIIRIKFLPYEPFYFWKIKVRFLSVLPNVFGGSTNKMFIFLQSTLDNHDECAKMYMIN